MELSRLFLYYTVRARSVKKEGETKKARQKRSAKGREEIKKEATNMAEETTSSRKN
jgi:hypothetical protein